MPRRRFDLNIFSDGDALGKPMSLKKTNLLSSGGVAIVAENDDGENISIELSVESAWRLSQALTSGVMLSEADIYDERDLSICEVMGFGISLQGAFDGDIKENDYLILSIDISDNKAVEFIIPKEELIEFSHSVFEIFKNEIKYSS